MLEELRLSSHFLLFTLRFGLLQLSRSKEANPSPFFGVIPSLHHDTTGDQGPRFVEAEILSWIFMLFGWNCRSSTGKRKLTAGRSRTISVGTMPSVSRLPVKTKATTL